MVKIVKVIVKKIISIINKFTQKSLIFTTIMIFILGLTIMLGTFCFTNPSINIKYMKYILSYFLDPTLIFLNLLPIFLLLYLLYILCNRIWISYSITTLFFIIPSLINKYKIIFRDFPFIFEDIGLFFEAKKMTDSYKITFDIYVILILVLYAAVAFFLSFIKVKKVSLKVKISLSIVIVFLVLFSYKNLYINDELYKKIGNEELINNMSQTQKFQIRGFVYAFINSSKTFSYPKPNDYNEEEAIKLLNSYTDHEIEEKNKVNIIAIMLEAYNDFSQYENIKFTTDIYEKFNKIVDESYHGTLISNVFSGGTINTERCFLTGYIDHNKYLKMTNSFVWYLKSQGYYTEAMHPIYGWFYNRRNVNKNLGFINYDYYESKYKSQSKEFLMDNDFFKEIIKGYEKNLSTNKPYFNFSVTYQNHGPFENINTNVADDGINYIDNKENYSESIYRTVNNYFRGIKQTNQALWELINYFKEVNEPVIILLFGDHNPGLGLNNAGYKMLGIDMDLSNEQGFMNYYSVPYVIWGNDIAKSTLNKNFKGVGATISPNYLMPELFEYLGFKGNKYMQFITDIKKTLPIINNDINPDFAIFKNDSLNSLNDYKKVQYYYINNYQG